MRYQAMRRLTASFSLFFAIVILAGCDGGGSGASSGGGTPPANQAPTVSVTSPVDNSILAAPADIVITVNASDDGSVSAVEFYDGTTLLGTSSTAPYSYSWLDVPAGTYNLTATAIDDAGVSTTSAVVRIVVNAPGNQLPTVALTSSADGASFVAPASVLLTANASDSDGSVTRVEFFEGSTRLGEDTSAPYEFTWDNVAAGTYTFTARAYDDIGVSTISAPAIVTVNAAANMMPTVSLTSPAGGATYTEPASIALSATASDSDGTVTMVEFYQDAVLLGTVITAPYSFVWNDVPAGSYVLTAEAYDNVGASAGSAEVAITVNELPPGVLPSPWLNGDVGSTGVAGSATYSTGLFTVEGSGADIWDSLDAFHFVYQPLSGDGTIVARIASMENTDGWAKAGVMIRESMSDNAAFAMMMLTPTNGCAFQYRGATGDGCASSEAGGSAPLWAKVVRSGNTFTGSYSSDGTNWTQAGSGTVNIATDASVGLAVTAHNNTVLNTSTFENVTVTTGSGPLAPVVTSATTASGMVGQTFSYQISATNSPTSYGATSLPAGLVINNSTGAISGTPTAAGTTSAAVSATNAGGTGTATLSITISPESTSPPVVSGPSTASGTVGDVFSCQISATNAPTSYDASPLPAGLVVNTGTGAITGTPTDAGSTLVTLSATNANGTGTATLTITISAAPALPPVVSSAATASGTVGASFSYQIIATNSPTSFGATPLPAGLVVSTSTGAITGIPTTTGTTLVTLSATNANGTGTAILTISVAGAPVGTTKTWTGLSSANWGHPGNWDNGIPEAGDDVVLTGAGSHRPANQDIASLSINSMTLDSSITNPFTINGSSITLTSTGTALTVDVAPMSLTYTSNVGIACPIVLGCRQTWTVTAGTWDENIAHVPTSIFTVTGVVSDGGNDYGLIKNGAGSLVLTANNTFGGVIEVREGQIAVGNDNNLGTPPAVATPGSVVLDGGVIWCTSGFILNSNRGIAVGPASGSGPGYLAVHYDQWTTYDGIIADYGSGVGSLGQLPVGTIHPFTQGELFLGGANTYSGDTHIISGSPWGPVSGNIAGGLLKLLAEDVIPHGPGKGNVIIDEWAYLDLYNFDATINGLSGAGVIQAAGAHVLTVGDNNATSTFSGNIQNSSGNVSLAKIGNGTLTLNGTINGLVTVNEGTVAGTGTLGNVLVPAGDPGNIAPGTASATGMLSVNNMTFGDSSATFTVRLNGTTAGTSYDQLHANGAVALNGCVLSASMGYTPATGDTLTIVTSNSAIGGTFNGLAEGALTQVSGYQCQISYAGNHVTLSQFTPLAGVDARLAFSQQPTDAHVDASIAPAVTVLVQDLAGNTMASSNATVSLSVGTNPSGGTLGGTVTADVVSGEATFANLSINQIGSGYTLNATSVGLSPATSTSFDILPAPPVIGSATTVECTVGRAFSYTITASSSPVSFTAAPLPAGLSFDTATGAITGAPTTTGTTDIALSATNAGGTGTATLTLTVIPNLPPTVSLTEPTGGATYTALAYVALIATASDSDGTIDRVEFYQGGTLLATTTSSPYLYNWINVLTGSYSLTAKAYDDAGLTSTSAAVNITVNPPSSNSAPVITVAASANPDPVMLPSTVAVSVDATDDGLPTPPAALTYTWEKLSGRGDVTFTPNGTAASKNSTVEFSTGGAYALRVTVSDGALSSVSDVNILASGGGTGLRGEYFDNADLTNLVLTRTDPTVDFTWDSVAPDASMGIDSYSVRWEGMVQAQHTETYTFYTQTANGVRLRINGQIIDQWGSHGLQEDTGTIGLTAGRTYYLRMEYSKAAGVGTGVAKLLWSSPSTPKQTVPQEFLFPLADGLAPVMPRVMTGWAADVSPANVLPEYPRPQLVRPDWMNLNGPWEWDTVADVNSPPYGQTLPNDILVPFPIQSALSGVGLNPGPKRIWYRRTFDVPAAWAGKRVIINFGAVDWEATVYVNGVNFGAHNGGYDSFEHDITDALNAVGPQELIVGVYDPSSGGNQPRGKQYDNPPDKYFYTTVAGIWQTVWLEPLPDARITGVIMTPDVDAQALHVTVNGSAAAAGMVARVTATYNGQPCGILTGNVGADLALPLSQLHLWSPNTPNLYDLEVELLSGPTVVDQASSYFAMRKVALGSVDGITRILLNDEFVFQLGYLDQGYWPDGLYTAPTDEALKYDLEMAKFLGFNMVRKHVKVEPDRWYYWADKLGLIVWQDMPNGGNNQDYDKVQFELEMQQMVQGMYNHPSIVAWVIFNEGWGQYDTARLTDFVKSLDASRLVDSASGWTDMGTGDIRDAHNYPGPIAPSPEATRAAVIGECGGLCLQFQPHSWDGSGYATADNSTQLTDNYVALMTTVLAQKADPGISGVVYTELTDIEHEIIGLMGYDREMKVEADRVRAVNDALCAP